MYRAVFAGFSCITFRVSHIAQKLHMVAHGMVLTRKIKGILQKKIWNYFRTQHKNMTYAKYIDSNFCWFVLHLIFGEQPAKTTSYVKHAKCIPSLMERSWGFPKSEKQVLYLSQGKFSFYDSWCTKWQNFENSTSARVSSCLTSSIGTACRGIIINRRWWQYSHIAYGTLESTPDSVNFLILNF